MITVKGVNLSIFFLLLIPASLTIAMDNEDVEMEEEAPLTQPLSDEDDDVTMTTLATTTQSPKPTPSFMVLEQDFFNNNSQGIYTIASHGAAFTPEQLVATATRYEARENDKTIILVGENPLESFNVRSQRVHAEAEHMKQVALEAQNIRKKVLKEALFLTTKLPDSLIELICQYRP